MGEGGGLGRGCAFQAEVLELGWPVSTSILSVAVVRADCDGVIRSWERCPGKVASETGRTGRI